MYRTTSIEIRAIHKSRAQKDTSMRFTSDRSLTFEMLFEKIGYKKHVDFTESLSANDIFSLKMYHYYFFPLTGGPPNIMLINFDDLKIYYKLHTPNCCGQRVFFKWILAFDKLEVKV